MDGQVSRWSGDQVHVMDRCFASEHEGLGRVSVASTDY